MAEATARPDPITHRRILTIAGPIVLSNATVPILGAVDTGVVGQLGEAAPIGAVGIGAIVLSTLYWLFGFLRMGTVGLTGQALGQGDQDEVDALLARALLIGVAAGVTMIVFQVPLLWAAFQVAPASEEVETLAYAYTQIRIYSAPAAIAVYGITGWLIAQERTAAVLIIQVWMNGLNMLLDLWFVLGLGWGVEGVAIATFIAEWSGALVGLWFCRAVFARTAWRMAEKVLDPARLVRFFALGGDILIRSVLLMAGFTSFTFLGARYGDVTLAANEILTQFMHITAYGLDGFAFAAEALVAQRLGARDPAGLRRAVLMTSMWGVALCVCLSLFFIGVGPTLIDIMTTSEEVRAETRVYLPWMAAAPLVGVAAWMLDGVFIGATRGRDMRNMMIISFAVYVAAVLLLEPAFANHGLWAALLVFFVARGVTLAWKYPGIEADAR